MHPYWRTVAPDFFDVGARHLPDLRFWITYRGRSADLFALTQSRFQRCVVDSLLQPRSFTVVLDFFELSIEKHKPVFPYTLVRPVLLYGSFPAGAGAAPAGAATPPSTATAAPDTTTALIAFNTTGPLPQQRP